MQTKSSRGVVLVAAAFAAVVAAVSFAQQAVVPPGPGMKGTIEVVAK